MSAYSHLGMFEGDQDREIDIDLSKDSDAELDMLINQTDIMAPQEMKAFFRTAAFKPILKMLMRSNARSLRKAWPTSYSKISARRRHRTDVTRSINASCWLH